MEAPLQQEVREEQIDVSPTVQLEEIPDNTNVPRRQIQDEDEGEGVAPIAPPNPQPQVIRTFRLPLPALRRSYEMLQSSGVWRKGNYAQILYFMPVTIALLVALLVDWNRPCSEPLKFWALAQICLQALSLMVNIVIILRLAPTDAPIDIQARRIRSLHYFFLSNRVLNSVWVSWFIIGMVWCFKAVAGNTCPKSSPYLFRMCFTIILLQLILLSFSLVFFCCASLMAELRVFAYIPGTPTRLSRGATESMIRALPCKMFKEGTLPKEDASCAICLCDYEVGEPIRFLLCDHHFHALCVDQWLLTNKTCPFCKQDIDSTAPKKLKQVTNV